MATTKSSTIKRYNGTDYDTINPITTGQNVYGSGTNASTPLVNSSDLIDAAYTKQVQVDTINARTSSSASTYGPGTSSQVLKSNGTYAYWGSDSSNTTECTIGANFKLKNQMAGHQVFITNNENKLVPMVSGASGSASVETSKTMNTESFNPFGLIAYTSSSSYRAADALCSGSTFVSYSSFDLRYAFNCGSTLTTNAPVYIVAEMQSDGQTAKLTSPYYSQTLPSTADGKIYIYLGQAVSTTNITMQQIHPVFEYIDGGLKVLPYDSNVVKLSGNQTIAGTKTFTSRPKSAEVYTKLSYISSPAGSGFPYIRTGVLRGVHYSNKLSCVLDGYFSESQNPYGFSGYDSGGQFGQKSGKWSTENDGLGTTNVNCVGSSNRATVTQVLDFSNSTNKLYIGDTMIAGRSINNAAYSQQADYPLFVAYVGTYTYNPAKLVLCSFKMYDGDTTGTLIRDFIPVRTANDEVGLLDLVENKFYRNQGTTAFTAGSDVETITVAGDLLVSSDVSLVGLTNDYNDLDNKPTIPTTYVSTVNGNSGDITGIATTSDLSGYVPTSRTINSKALSSNVTLYGTDVAMSSTDATTVKTAIDNVVSVAEGKSQAYSLAYNPSQSGTSNSVFNSQNDTITISDSNTLYISGGKVTGSQLVSAMNLKIGDVIYVTNTDVPDRWVGVISSGTYTLYKMETSKVDLSGYALDNSVVKLTGDQSIDGVKSFEDRPQLVTTPRLPNTYQEVAYIQASGSQYIDTGFKTTTEKLKVEFACSFPFGMSGMSLMGSNSPYSLVPYGTGGNVIGHWVGSSGGIMSITYENSYNDVTYELDNGSISCTINGSTTSTTYSGTIINNYNFYIFGKNGGGNSSERGAGYRLYYMKITNNGTLVRNFVPCYRISDSVIGLYDLVNNTFYTNAGSGTFAKGGNVGTNQFVVDSDLADYVPTTTKINGKMLDGNITLSASDVSALPSSTTYIKSASVSGDTLTLTKQDDSSVTFTPSGGGGSSDIPVTSASGSSQQLARNTFYDFGDRGTTSGETVTITLGSARSGVVNEYMGEILVDEYPITLSTPSTITWAESDGVANTSNTLTLEEKYTYQFNIIRNLGLIVRFPNGVLDKPNPTINGLIISWSAIPNATDYKVVDGIISENHSATTTSTSYDLSNWYPTLGTLSTPTNLTASAGSGSSYTITLTWDSVSNASTYTVYYKTSSASSYSSTNVSTNTTTLTNLQAATTYNLYVKANAVSATAAVTVTAQSTHYVNTTSDIKYFYYTKYNESSNSSTVNCTTTSGG